MREELGWVIRYGRSGDSEGEASNTAPVHHAVSQYKCLCNLKYTCFKDYKKGEAHIVSGEHKQAVGGGRDRVGGMSRRETGRIYAAATICTQAKNCRECR